MCEVCNNTGHYEIPNHVENRMEQVECIDCALQDQYLAHMSDLTTKVLMSLSKESLAVMVAKLAVSAADKHGSLSHLDAWIATKNNQMIMGLVNHV